jgi:hypothetical protein
MDEGRFLLLKAELEEKYKTVKSIYHEIKRSKETFSKTQADVDSMGYKLHNLYSAYEGCLRQLQTSSRTR